MNIIPVRVAFFDDEATLAMGEAFDHACVAIRRSGISVAVREIIARRIVEAARGGERDPARLHRQALRPFRIEEMSMLAVSAGRDSPVPACASVAHAA